MSEWQPIETAPEGEQILLLCNEAKTFQKNDEPAKAIFSGFKYYDCNSDGGFTDIYQVFSVPQPDCREAAWMDLNWTPVFWMPLPALPENKS